ncbi:RAN GTPase-activating protein 1 [Tetrabaena socialis]|uniref:RAN GTPase-activating protein 1 n=1 Tax=Tetrabaena socialis TaxID=47790 RepID=A0A2J8A091_9CHLO|nr:RAN GTPase-activating protein 1 [Tetrabaena socialis]|eukprot:PNH05943.1 RAN GTPase-activating protein 1 [Tetrabaena socialis]
MWLTTSRRPRRLSGWPAGRCAFLIAPHPVFKQNALLAPSAAVRLHSRTTHLPGSTFVLDRDSGRLVDCDPELCPLGAVVPAWPTDAAQRRLVLGNSPELGGAGAPPYDGAAAVAASSGSGSGGGGGGGGGVVANFVPVLGVSPLGVGINGFTSLLQQSYSAGWVRALTHPDTVWELVLAPAAPLAPFRYEHFSASSLRRWAAAGYDPPAASAYLDLSYDILTHPNLLSFPASMQRFIAYRAALHAAAYTLLASPSPVEAVMDDLAAALGRQFSPEVPGFSTLRLQYIYSIGRADLLAAPAPPPPPPPPDVSHPCFREAYQVILLDLPPAAAAAATDASGPGGCGYPEDLVAQFLSGFADLADPELADTLCSSGRRRGRAWAGGVAGPAAGEPPPDHSLLQDRGVRDVVEAPLALQNAPLASLSLQNVGLSVHACAATAQLLAAPGRLTRLQLYNNMSDDAGAAHIAGLLARAPLMEDLRFASSRVGPAGGIALARGLAAGRCLVRLDLSDNPLTAEVAPALAAALAAQPHLRTLNLNDTGLGPDGVAAVCGALLASYGGGGSAPAQRLEELGLALNEVDPTAAKLRAKLATQHAHAEVFGRDDFLF